MSKLQSAIASSLLFLSIGHNASANENLSKDEIITIQKETKISNIINGKYFTDSTGKHFLVFTQNKKIVKQKDSEDLDVIDIAIHQFTDINGKLSKTWSINDSVSCPGLDINAEFIDKATKIIDPLNTGMKSAIVAYKLSCRGGVDPQEFKVIYKNKNQKIALRGDSLINLPGLTSGGNYKLSTDFKEANPQIQKIMLEVWNKYKQD